MEPRDTLVFLGDYIDRGSDSKGCIDRILRLQDEAPFEVITLLGNHEQWMLRSFENPTRHSWLVAMEGLSTVKSYSEKAAEELARSLEEAGLQIWTERIALPYELFFEAMPPSHLQFFMQLQTFYNSDDLICVHGGIDEDGSLDFQNPDTYVWGPLGFPEDYRGSKAIVYGHRNDGVLLDGSVKPRVGANRTYGLDTISHGVLTAMRFPGETVFQSAIGD